MTDGKGPTILQSFEGPRRTKQYVQYGPLVCTELKYSLMKFGVDEKKEKNQCPREGMFSGSFAKDRGRDEG